MPLTYYCFIGLFDNWESAYLFDAFFMFAPMPNEDCLDVLKKRIIEEVNTNYPCYTLQRTQPYVCCQLASDGPLSIRDTSNHPASYLEWHPEESEWVQLVSDEVRAVLAE